MAEKEYIGIETLSKKASITGTEKIPVSPTQYMETQQIVDDFGLAKHGYSDKDDEKTVEEVDKENTVVRYDGTAEEVDVSSYIESYSYLGFSGEKKHTSTDYSFLAWLIPINKFDRLFISGRFTNVGYGLLYAFYGKDEVFISGFAPSESTNYSNYEIKDIPENAKFISIYYIHNLIYPFIYKVQTAIIQSAGEMLQDTVGGDGFLQDKFDTKQDKLAIDVADGDSNKFLTEQGDFSFINHAQLNNLNADSGNLHVSQDEKSTWNGKQNDLGFTPENAANKTQTLTADGTGAKYPTVDAVNEGLALKADTVDVMQNKQSIATLESILSDVNVNQEAQVTTSGASPLSLPKNAANGGMSVKLEGLTAENLVVNGNFENGLIGLFYHDEGNGTSTLAINSSTPISGNYDIRLTITTPTTGGRPILYGLNGVGNIGDKIYLHFYAKILSGTPSMSGINDGANFVSISSGDVINGRNTRIIDVMGTDNTLGIIYFKSPSVWDMQMDNFMRINLTETFGAGNEPTKEQCDLIFSDYFEGVKSFEPTGRVRSFDKNGLNPTALYLTAPKLRSNGLVKDEIRKGANGYELVKRVGVGTLGNNLVTNGTFDTATGWELTGATTISGGALRVYSPDGSHSSARFNIPTIVVGKRYLLKYDVLQNNGGYISCTDIGSNIIDTTVGVNKTFEFTAVDVGVFFLKRVNVCDVTFDNVKLHEILPQDGTISNTSTFTELSDGTILYTLATPVITPISYGGVLNSAESGTVYFEPAVADAGVYGANIAIQLTDFPISAIESISKYEDGVFTPLNTATAVIAVDGLSFTHPDLASGDLVTFTYLYSLESTGRSMTLTYYDSRYVVKDTANTNVYKITPKITSGELTWELTLV